MSQTRIVMNTVAYYPSVQSHRYHSTQSLHHRGGTMKGAQRVITFCLLTAVLPTILLIIPLYLRHVVFADITYAVAESDVMEIVDGISSIFCQEHLLRMNSTFQAFQVKGSPKLSDSRKHIRLHKSMSLPDDTLEYWGFYLLKGATVELSLCSRFEGSRILLVKGERNLRTCGLMEHSEKPILAHMARGLGNVKVTFDTNETAHWPTQNEQYEGEDDNEDDLKVLQSLSEAYINKHRSENRKNSTSPEVLQQNRKIRHSRSRLNEMNKSNTTRNIRKGLLKRQRQKRLKESLNSEARVKRNTVLQGHILDAKVGHGHAGNETTEGKDESSVSSFENNLLACYDGQILLIQAYPPTDTCSREHILDNTTHIMKTIHEVESDGYYYYIFYSDNDIVVNNIHAVFNIYKPTYQYTNFTKGCINQTECNFPISFWSDETVIVEVPTRDGIEHNNDNDVMFLVSSCYPRMAIYIIFPISVLFLILGCAFL